MSKEEGFSIKIKTIIPKYPFSSKIVSLKGINLEVKGLQYFIFNLFKSYSKIADLLTISVKKWEELYISKIL